MKLTQHDHVLMLTIHHIASDGWSTGVLVNEFTSLYEGYTENRRAELPALPIQYADYAVWQREWLQGETLEQQLSYWRRQLDGASVLELSTDRPRPAVASHRGESVDFSLSAEVTDRLRQVSRRRGVTMFMTLLAGFQVLLSRYSGQLDVVVGTDVANRNRLETEHLIGFFINQLVLRSDLSADPTFEQLLDSVRETTLSAYQHQDVPFEKLVEELQPERDLSRSPLFQVKMVLAERLGGRLQLAGLKLAGFDASAQSIKLAINLMLRDAGPVVTGSLKYAAELFDDRTARRLAGHLVRVLESASADPACRVLQLDMLSEAERAQILEQSSGGGCEAGASRGASMA